MKSLVISLLTRLFCDEILIGMVEALKDLSLSDGSFCAAIAPQQQVAQQDTTEYIITIKTGDLKSAGTDGEVKIQVIGSDLCQTEPTVLDQFFENDFEKNQTNRYTMTMKDVGVPFVCKICKCEIVEY